MGIPFVFRTPKLSPLKFIVASYRMLAFKFWCTKTSIYSCDMHVEDVEEKEKEMEAEWKRERTIHFAIHEMYNNVMYISCFVVSFFSFCWDEKFWFRIFLLTLCSSSVNSFRFDECVTLFFSSSAAAVCWCMRKLYACDYVCVCLSVRKTLVWYTFEVKVREWKQNVPFMMTSTRTFSFWIWVMLQLPWRRY